MSDETELRDRIAECQRRVLKRRALISDVDLPDYLAQAIIDELGLTVEKSMVCHEVHDDGTWTTWPSQARVVGQWERPGQEPRP